MKTTVKKFIRGFGFWFAQFTWGSLMTLIGLPVVIGLRVAGFKPMRVGPIFCFTVGRDWGSISFGPFALVQSDFTRDLLIHSLGHSYQNIIFGPAYPLVVAIPGMMRFCGRISKRVEDRLSFMSAAGILSILPVVVLFLSLGLHYDLLIFHIIYISWIAYIASLMAWQLIEIKRYHTLKLDKDYLEVWFERQATSLGDVIYYNW